MCPVDAGRPVAQQSAIPFFPLIERDTVFTVRMNTSSAVCASFMLSVSAPVDPAEGNVYAANAVQRSRRCAFFDQYLPTAK